MIDSFRQSDPVTVQPNDLDVPYTFRFPANSVSTANDGAIPYGETISAVAVTAHKKDGTDVTAGLISGTPDMSGDTVTVKLDYPGSPGEYHLTFVLTLSGGADIEFDFNRVYARNV